MSAQNGQPPVVPQQAPAQPQNAARAREEQIEQIAQAIIGGEIVPGVGYLSPDLTKPVRKDPPSPDDVRGELLRAIEACAQVAQLPFGRVTKTDAAKAALAFSQSYLLLDPTVDENGVPVEGEGSVAQAQAKAVHQFPPRVPKNPAEQKIEAKNEGKSKALQKTRGQRPLPKPRVGA